MKQVNLVALFKVTKRYNEFPYLSFVIQHYAFLLRGHKRKDGNFSYMLSFNLDDYFCSFTANNDEEAIEDVLKDRNWVNMSFELIKKF